MDAAFALEVLDKAPYVTVSMTRPDGSPYGLPLSLARTDERTFYFHCALEGDKLDSIRHCPTVFLSAIGVQRYALFPTCEIPKNDDFHYIEPNEKKSRERSHSASGFKIF